MTIPMTPEYRAQIAEMLARPYPTVAAETSVSALLAAGRALWDENERLTTERDQARVVTERIQADRERLNTISVGIDQQKDKLITALQVDAAEQRTRAETAERELAEMRERIGEASVEYAALYTSWASSSHGETKAIGPFKTTDELLAAQEGELWPIGRDSWSLGSRLAGQWRPAEWQSAEQQPEDGDRG